VNFGVENDPIELAAKEPITIIITRIKASGG